jgi:uncharacterized membrane protein
MSILKKLTQLLFISSIIGTVFLQITTSFAMPSYYADLVFDIDREGYVAISGTNNLEENITTLRSSEYTSKEKNIWTFEYSLEPILDTFVFEVILPEGATIKYIKTTPDMRIDQSENRLKIIGSGEQRKLNIILQYELKDSITNSSYLKEYSIIAISAILIVLSIGLFIYKYKKEQRTLIENNNTKIQKNNVEIKENKKEIIENKKEQEKKNHNLEEEVEELEQEVKELEQELNEKTKSKTLTYLEEHFHQLPERQQEIIKILQEKKTPITQKELEKKMDIPKSSISRNLKTLEIKGIIVREKIAQTKYIKLNQQ